MGYPSRLGPFKLDDAFLRRIAGRSRISTDGTIAPEAFKARPVENTLSFTLQNETLRTPEALDEYQRAKRLESGDLPGICKLTCHDLTSSLHPPLPPRPQADDQDANYGHLHCVTDPPAELQREQMAKLATRNGVVRDYVRFKSPK